MSTKLYDCAILRIFPKSHKSLTLLKTYLRSCQAHVFDTLPMHKHLMISGASCYVRNENFVLRCNWLIGWDSIYLFILVCDIAASA